MSSFHTHHPSLLFYPSHHPLTYQSPPTPHSPTPPHPGAKTRFEMTHLRPNSLYHIKLRYCGPRSNSLLSDPLVVMTAPLAPEQPQVVTVSAVSARIKVRGWV